jgi:hypothetical protein
MSGELAETNYAEVRENAESAQSQLSSWSTDPDPTTIAVVRAPRDTNIEEYCDEWRKELGMPRWALERFWEYRAGYRTNTAVSNPTRRAYDDANLDLHYEKYITDSEQAQQSIDELVSRLNSGEDITLVCFEEPSEPCHRHRLKALIEARRDTDLSASPTPAD